ncbi:claspin [Sitodiplosis mosellana]|uniref:claspin n=1 Tax=Sitodiplosis mosellana TaxID=263140 RepID=UPI0024438CFD|nr:claspin [Sitodiplosis mosellana]
MDECFAESLVYSDSENSDGEEGGVELTHVPELKSSPEKINEGPTNQNDGNSRESGESDEDDMNRSVKKTKKTSRFLSSDDENENSDNASKNTEDVQEPTKINFNVRPSICDSDTKSSSDGNQSNTEMQTKKTTKKLKKKKQKIQKQKQMSNGSESDAGDSEDDNKNSKKSTRKRSTANRSGGSGDSSGSDSSSADSNDQMHSIENVKPREKTVQRMSAKMAEQQMKEIQSESQRMARELHVNIPYHKPKSHSLKEFLSRRSIVQQQEKLATKPFVKAAVAIKMSGNDLIQYMHECKEREQEAEEFFQEQETDECWNSKASDSDESEEEDAGGAEMMVAEKPEELPDEIKSNECEEVQINSNTSATKTNEELDKSVESNNHGISENGNDGPTDDQTNAIESEVAIELHTSHAELDYELNDTVAPNKKVKPTFPTDFVPKLNGEKGFVIDLETNDVKPMPKTGVDELLARFIENAVVKPQKVETQDISIFRTDNGSIEKHTVHVNVDNMKTTRERRPGESHFKLRAELGRKIKENREKLIAQRLQEEKEQELSCKQMESEDGEELDDLSDSEMDCTEPTEQIKELDEEEMEQAIDENNEENIESESDSENNDDGESEIADIELDANAVQKPRKRILTAMDDDSDTENPTISGPIEDYDASHAIENQSKEGMNISELESEILQLSSVTDSESKKETSKLFEECDGDYEDIGESQLMALCSGSFATQHLNKQSVQGIEQTQENEPTKTNGTQLVESEEIVRAKPVLSSSDEEEESNENACTQKKSKKKRKQHTLVYSDDEGGKEDTSQQDTKDEDESECLSNNEDDQESVEDEEQDLGERYIEYDSDENEIEVEMKKNDVRRKASDFFENEAELSESEWGSDDEDEKDLNRYEAELGDADKFDKVKLRGELERIRLREQIDQDSRELRILTERFIEEEDGGQERERKFRWKHLNNTDLNDDQIQNINQEEIGIDNSDDENEENWRRMRYEREQLLKKQMSGDKDVTIEQTTTSGGIAEQTTNKNATILNSSRRISIIKPVGAATSKTISPFLITKGGVNMMHYNRKSFLNRDSPILEKLASLSKAGTDNDSILNTAKGKGNYVFVATAKKDSVKRKSDSEMGGSLGAEPIMNPSKKSKLNPKEIRPQTKAFFESLN